MKGKIIKGIAGLYYVHTESAGVFECKAKGIFRNQKRKPLVGDNVLLKPLEEGLKTATIEELLPRRNELFRPAVANIDQVVLLFAAAEPEPNWNLLDRFLILMAEQKLPVILVFNKADLITESQKEEIEDGYRNTGYEIRFLSAKRGIGLNELKELLYGKTTVLAGPSGVGKSTLTNMLQSGVQMETGAISEKIKRGKHTTRHSELIWVCTDTYLLDTPGFSSLTIEHLEAEELKRFFPEFMQYEGHCRFRDCMHENEPGCLVKQAVSKGEIAKRRYENYLLLYKELRQRKKYK